MVPALQIGAGMAVIVLAALAGVFVLLLPLKLAALAVGARRPTWPRCLLTSVLLAVIDVPTFAFLRPLSVLAAAVVQLWLVSAILETGWIGAIGVVFLRAIFSVALWVGLAILLAGVSLPLL